MNKTRVAAASALLLLLTGCGGGGGGQTPPASYGGAQRGQAGPGGGFPGGSGEVVEIDGSTAQVQSRSGQVAVSWTKDTTFTREVAGSASDVKVGSCVVVQPAGETASGGSDDQVAAGTVRILPASDGQCTVGGRPSGAPEGERRQLPEGERPSGDAPRGDTPGGDGRQRVMGAFGQVTSVTDDGFVVKSTRPGSDDDTSVTVSTSDDTTFSTTAAASASAVKVGACVTSMGKADDTGAITATTIAISQKTDGECGMLMRFGSGPGQGRGQGGDA